MLILGIDPGLTGAVSVLGQDGTPECVIDLPVIRDLSLAWIDGGELQSTLLLVLGGRPARVVIERVSAMPKQGVTSSFTFGITFGSILGALRCMRLPIEFVTPVVWKRALGLTRPNQSLTEKKHAALDRARLLFPDLDLSLAKHHGRADALLIAHWAQKVRQPAREAA